MRCVSSSTPISAAQRKALWGTSLHHSFEKKASASVESLYNSCTDLDTASIWDFSCLCQQRFRGDSFIFVNSTSSLCQLSRTALWYSPGIRLVD
ncbi:hypothetical protein Aduo_002551 [Ancylostoma duodenale]